MGRNNKLRVRLMLRVPFVECLGDTRQDGSLPARMKVSLWLVNQHNNLARQRLPKSASFLLVLRQRPSEQIRQVAHSAHSRGAVGHGNVDAVWHLNGRNASGIVDSRSNRNTRY